MNKGSEGVDDKSAGDSVSRKITATTQDTAPARRATEQVAQQKGKTKRGTSARKRRAPFVL